MPRATAADLLIAANLCANPPEGTTPKNIERLAAVALWLRQVAHDKATADYAKVIADRSGRKITSPEVQAAAREVARRNFPTPTQET